MPASTTALAARELSERAGLGAEAIAEALGIPFRELFPDSYTLGRHDTSETTSKTKGKASQKDGGRADGKAA
jgi:hypothetical protein